MKRLRNHLVGIEQGTVNLFSDFEDGGDMWDGQGPRSRTRSVAFSESFRSVPTVQVTLSMWDAHHAANMRADLTAEDVTPDGFTLAFRTWGDTRIARARASWTAIGEAAHADEWDLY